MPPLLTYSGILPSQFIRLLTEITNYSFSLEFLATLPLCTHHHNKSEKERVCYNQFLLVRDGGLGNGPIMGGLRQSRGHGTVFRIVLQQQLPLFGDRHGLGFHHLFDPARLSFVDGTSGLLIFVQLEDPVGFPFQILQNVRRNVVVALGRPKGSVAQFVHDH